MNNYQISDILHFDNYCFTDTGKSASHFALVLLPSSVMDFDNNLLCCVVTSKFTKFFALKLSKSKYKCFSKDSYMCLNRRDINSISDLSKSKQPVGRLFSGDIKKAFKILKCIRYGTKDLYLVPTIIREWKEIR